MLFAHHLPPWVYPLLFLAGAMAGTVDAMAGGGGLISLPALLAAGLPVPLALGTNKLASVFGSGSATLSYVQRGLVRPRACLPGIALTAAGSLAGALLVRRLDPAVLSNLIPWLLAAMVVYLVFRPTLGETSRHRLLETLPFYLLFGPGLGFYDGFFGPGTGSFWTAAFIVVLGQDFLQAAAHTKLMNFTSNLAALALFAAGGAVVFAPGLAMGAGQLLGGRLGAHLAATRGARFIRPIFLVMAGLTVLKLLYSHSLRP